MKIDKRESFAAVAQIEKIKESTSNNLILNIILVPRTKNVKSHKKIKIKKKFDVLVSSNYFQFKTIIILIIILYNPKI